MKTAKNSECGGVIKCCPGLGVAGNHVATFNGTNCHLFYGFCFGIYSQNTVNLSNRVHIWHDTQHEHMQKDLSDKIYR